MLSADQHSHVLAHLIHPRLCWLTGTSSYWAGLVLSQDYSWHQRCHVWSQNCCERPDPIRRTISNTISFTGTGVHKIAAFYVRAQLKGEIAPAMFGLSYSQLPPVFMLWRKMKIEGLFNRWTVNNNPQIPGTTEEWPFFVVTWNDSNMKLLIFLPWRRNFEKCLRGFVSI